MRLRAASVEQITVAASALSGPVLAAVPLGALACVPLLAGPTAVTVLTACGLLLLAATCLVVGRLWPPRVDMFPRQKRLERRGKRVGFDDVHSLRLTVALGSPAESYEVRVRFRDRTDWLLLSGLDPARVLSDLGQVVKLTGLTVEQGWDMPTDARPWLEPPVEPTDVHFGAVPLLCRTQPSQSLVALSVRIAAVLTAAIIVVLVAVRLIEGKGIAALSLVLGSALVLILVGVSFAVAFERTELEAKGMLVVRVRSWGVTREIARIARTDLVRAYPVRAASQHHLLLETRSGLVAVPMGAPGRSEHVRPSELQAG
jgi:hypothetical protein